MAKKNPTKRKSKPPEIDFETALADVEEIVSQLEGGELGLSESLERYEKGIKQLKRCNDLLDAAQQKVTLLSGFDAEGNPVTEPLRSSDGKSEDSPATARRVRKRSRSHDSPTSEGTTELF